MAKRKKKLLGPRTLKNEGRAILVEQKRRVKKEAIGGILPSRGLWVFSPERRRLLGKILMVRRKGQLVIKGYHGQRIEMQQERIAENDYVYGTNLPKGKWLLFPYVGEPVALKQVELDRFDIMELDESGTPIVIRQPKVVILSPCLCGCETECKSRFVVGHDAKFKSVLRKATKKKLKLNPEQQLYLENATWMTRELWNNVK